MHPAFGQPAPQFRGRAALVRERKQFVGVPVESGATVAAGSAGAGLRFQAGGLGGGVERGRDAFHRRVFGGPDGR